MFHSSHVAVAFSLCLCVMTASARASGRKIPLAPEAIVDGPSIYLSDVLPKSAPEQLRLAAEEILVGQSPRPGSIRILSNQTIEALLEGEEVLDKLEVPEQIVIRRSGRPITKQEVVEAIQNALRNNKDLTQLVINPANIRFNAMVLVSTPKPDLEVRKIEIDRALHQMNFWLVSRTDPATLPFLVMARPDIARSNPDLAAAEFPRGAEEALLNPRIARDARRPAVIVESGKAAQLHLVSGKTTEMFLTATALEKGSLGQCIRVRLESTGRVLEAEVVGPGRLEAEF